MSAGSPRLLSQALPALVITALMASGCPKQPSPTNAVNNLSRSKRLKVAFQAEPCNLGTGIDLAEAYREESNPAEAERVYSSLMGCGDALTTGLSMNALARLAEEQHKLDQAAEWLSKSVADGTPETQSQAWYLISELVGGLPTVPAVLLGLQVEGQPVFAAEATPAAAQEAALQQVLATGHPAPEVYRALGDLERKRGNALLALENYQIYLAGNAEDLESWFTAAAIAHEAGEPATAIFYLHHIASRGSQEQRTRATQGLAALAASPASPPSS